MNLGCKLGNVYPKGRMLLHFSHFISLLFSWFVNSKLKCSVRLFTQGRVILFSAQAHKADG